MYSNIGYPLWTETWCCQISKQVVLLPCNLFCMGELSVLTPVASSILMIQSLKLIHFLLRWSDSLRVPLTGFPCSHFTISSCILSILDTCLMSEKLGCPPPPPHPPIACCSCGKPGRGWDMQKGTLMTFHGRLYVSLPDFPQPLFHHSCSFFISCLRG